jgi:pyruvate-formate lyase-activating enzyme
VSQVKLCKLSDRDLALLAVKAMVEKGAREVTDVHVKSFVRIIKKYCEEVEKSNCV